MGAARVVALFALAVSHGVARVTDGAQPSLQHTSHIHGADLAQQRNPVRQENRLEPPCPLCFGNKHHTTAGRPLLLAAPTHSAVVTMQKAPDSQLSVLGRFAGFALASEVVPYMNSALLLVAIRYAFGVKMSAAELVEAAISQVLKLGNWAYPCYGAFILSLHLLPLVSPLPFVLGAGMLFGAARGTALVCLSCSSAALISRAISRIITQSANYSLEDISPSLAAVDRAVATGSPTTAFLLVLLLRLSPIMPFVFSNYLSGLSSVPAYLIFAGTLLGTLPTQTVYVTAGTLGRAALEGELPLPPWVLALGGLATVLTVAVVGRVSQTALQGMDLQTGSQPHTV